LSDESKILQIYSLDGGRIFVGGIEIQEWRVHKARDILFYLLEYGPVKRDILIKDVWAGETEGATPNNFRNTLYHLRLAIAPAAKILFTSGFYELRGAIWYDASEFRKGVDIVVGDAMEKLAAALSLYKQDYTIRSSDKSWTHQVRQDLLELYVKAATMLAVYYTFVGRHEDATNIQRQIAKKAEKAKIWQLENLLVTMPINQIDQILIALPQKLQLELYKLFQKYLNLGDS
jgi:two-component SAPR family response regulator